MHLLQQIAAQAASSHIEWAVKGLLGVAGTTYLGAQYWSMRKIFRMDEKLTRVHLTVCGNPDIKGDEGMAGDVKCLKEGYAVHEDRLNDHDRTLRDLWGGLSHERPFLRPDQ